MNREVMLMGQTALGLVLKTVPALVTGLFLANATALAQPPSGFPTGGGTTRLGGGQRAAVVNGTDPTDIVQRFEARNRYESHEAGGRLNVTDLIYDMTPFQNTALRFQAPFVYNDPKAGESESGLGDVSIRPLVKFYDDDYAKVAGFAEVKFATATDPLLSRGTGRNDLALGAFGSYEFTRDLTGVVEVSQVLSSFGGDEARPRNDLTTIRPFVVFQLPDGWWLQAETEYNRNWVEEIDDERVFVRGQAGWKFGSNEAAYASLITQPAGDNPVDIGIEVGARYIY